MSLKNEPFEEGPYIEGSHIKDQSRRICQLSKISIADLACQLGTGRSAFYRAQIWMGHGGAQPGLQTFREDVMLCMRYRHQTMSCSVCGTDLSPSRALPTETKVESGTFQSKSGTSVELSNSGLRTRRPQTPGDESAFDVQALFCTDLDGASFCCLN